MEKTVEEAIRLDNIKRTFGNKEPDTKRELKVLKHTRSDTAQVNSNKGVDVTKALSEFKEDIVQAIKGISGGGGDTSSNPTKQETTIYVPQSQSKEQPTHIEPDISEEKATLDNTLNKLRALKTSEV